MRNSLFINNRKLKQRTGKALFLILPMTVLVALTVLVSSHADNIQQAASDVILGTAAQQNTVLEVELEQDNSDPRAMFEGTVETYTDTDEAAIEAIEHVTNAQIVSSLPISNVTLNQISDTEIDLSTIIGLDADIAALYTSEDFTYTEGEPIPVILNASTFTNTYEDWGGEKTITVERQRPGQMATSSAEPEDPEESMQNLSPIKTEALEYDEDELVGQVLTLSVNGFEDQDTYTIEMSSDGVVYTKLTAKKIANAETARKDAIKTYWKYSALNVPITYEVKVVGVIESDSDTATYIPTAAGEQIMKDYFQREIDARRDTTAPVDELNAIYNGLTFDGTELETDLFSQILRNSRFGAQGNAVFREGERPGGPQELDSVQVEFEDTESYDIPGLVVKIDADTEEVTGLYKYANAYTKSIKSSTSILVKIDDVANRDDVVTELNTIGYSYQDFSNLALFGSIDQTLQTVTVALAVAFIAISIGVIVLTMSKFVSDSKKEIGIFRAMGMTKGSIRLLFTSQALIYTIIAYAVGLGLGVVLTFGLSGTIASWFDSIISSTLAEGFEVVQTVDSSMFQQISVEPLAVYTIILLIITIIISLIPANRAAQISPVEAIRSE